MEDEEFDKYWHILKQNLGREDTLRLIADEKAKEEGRREGSDSGENQPVQLADRGQDGDKSTHLATHARRDTKVTGRRAEEREEYDRHRCT